jgi:probable phosphoglycerate mutase
MVTTKNFYIFRHGQSSYNVSGRTQGQTNDSVLTDEGKEQAKKIGERLVGKDIRFIISSPLKRAQETTELVNEALGAEVIYDDRFTEVTVGEIEGLHYTVIREKFGEKYDKWRSSDRAYEEIHFEGGETKKQVRERVFEGLNYYANVLNCDNVAVSSHGIMLTQVLLILGGKAEEVANGAIVHLQYVDGKWNFARFVQ